MNKTRERKVNARKRRMETIRNIGNPKKGHNDLVQRVPELRKAEKNIDSTSLGASVQKNTAKGNKALVKERNYAP
jgi:hypothetical protein